MTVYPNPVSNTLYLNNISLSIKHIEIMSVNGQILLSNIIDHNRPEISVDISTLSNGPYLFTSTDNRGIIRSSKIIIQH